MINQYSVNNITVGSILGQISGGTIAIPEIQRPFVWESVKVRDLIDSLYKVILLDILLRGKIMMLS